MYLFTEYVRQTAGVLARTFVDNQFIIYSQNPICFLMGAYALTISIFFCLGDQNQQATLLLHTTHAEIALNSFSLFLGGAYVHRVNTGVRL